MISKLGKSFALKAQQCALLCCRLSTDGVAFTLIRCKVCNGTCCKSLSLALLRHATCPLQTSCMLPLEVFILKTGANLTALQLNEHTNSAVRQHLQCCLAALTVLLCVANSDCCMCWRRGRSREGLGGIVHC